MTSRRGRCRRRAVNEEAERRGRKPPLSLWHLSVCVRCLEEEEYPHVTEEHKNHTLFQSGQRASQQENIRPLPTHESQRTAWMEAHQSTLPLISVDTVYGTVHLKGSITVHVFWGTVRMRRENRCTKTRAWTALRCGMKQCCLMWNNPKTSKSATH